MVESVLSIEVITVASRVLKMHCFLLLLMSRQADSNNSDGIIVSVFLDFGPTKPAPYYCNPKF